MFGQKSKPSLEDSRTWTQRGLGPQSHLRNSLLYF